MLYRQVSSCFLFAAFPSSRVTFFLQLLVACCQFGGRMVGGASSSSRGLRCGGIGGRDCRGAPLQLRRSPPRADRWCGAPVHTRERSSVSQRFPLMQLKEMMPFPRHFIM